MFSDALTVFLAAAAPVTELRAAIPLGIVSLGMTPSVAVFFAVAGNMMPVVAVYALGGWWLRFVERRQGVLHRMTDAVVRRAHDKIGGDVGKRGLVALALFVAVPLPMTGAWTGAVGAFAFRIPFRKAFSAILAGVAIAAVIVASATTGAIEAFEVFL